MSRAVYPAERLLDEATDLNARIFLDSTSWDYFRKWVAVRLPEFKARIEKGLTLWVFEAEFAKTQPKLFNIYMEQQNTLDELDDVPIGLQLEDELGIRFLDDRLPQDSEEYVFEIQQIYFHDEINMRLKATHAEFMLLGRRAARNEPCLRILTAFPAFQRTIDAEVFVLPNSIAITELPADFDIFTDLHLHQRLRDTISVYYHNRLYASAVFEAAKELYEYLRQASGSTSDGGTLVDETVKIVTDWNGKKLTVKQAPKFSLNALSSEEEVGEQEGYYRFIQGVTKAIRNSNAHLTAADPFIVSRFDNQKTAIKVLCFLSLLFEKIDQRVP